MATEFSEAPQKILFYFCVKIVILNHLIFQNEPHYWSPSIFKWQVGWQYITIYLSFSLLYHCTHFCRTLRYNFFSFFPVLEQVCFLICLFVFAFFFVHCDVSSALCFLSYFSMVSCSFASEVKSYPKPELSNKGSGWELQKEPFFLNDATNFDARLGC